MTGRIEHCSSTFQVSEVDTLREKKHLLFKADAGVLAGVSVAVEAGDELYIGAYTGDHLLRLQD